jgi:hypothetical protein
MPDVKPFQSAREEKRIVIEVSAKEAHLIKMMRQYTYGKFIINKANGILVRMEIGESRLLDEEGGLDLELRTEVNQ